jgi:squalene cyclase
VWCDALIVTYSGDHYGVELGAHYADVLKWLPAMRPYRGSENGTNPDFFDTVYAVTHIIYTLNNYNQYRQSPILLPAEYQFLKSNLREAIKGDDPDMLGEFMDTLRAFGLTSEDPDIRAGMGYLLSHQNRDGSWGKTYIRNRYHPTWNGISGLSEYAWRAGEGLSFPEIKPLLERWNRETR